MAAQGSVRRATIAVVATLATALAGACSQPPAPADRADDIRAARAALDEPLRAVGDLVVTVTAEVNDVRLGEPPEPDARRRRADDLTAVVERLEGELPRLADVDLAGDGPAVAAARAAAADAVAAAEDAVAAARADLDLVRQLATADAELAAVAATWDDPGSRSQLMRRFEEAAAAAEAVRTRVSGLPERPPCGEAVARRIAAAEHVSNASRELRDLAAARRGEALAQRVDELAGDPYGLATAVIGTLDARDRACVEQEAAVSEAARAFGAATDRLVGALNPPRGVGG